VPKALSYPLALTPSRRLSMAALAEAAPCTHDVEYLLCTDDHEAAAQQRAVLTSKEPMCSAAGLCDCPSPSQIFFGKTCIENSEWDADPYFYLSKKWHEVPLVREVYRGKTILTEMTRSGTELTERLLKLSDEDLKSTWLKVRPQGDCLTDFFVNTFKGKKVIDVGAGFARQSLQVAMGGAHVTFLDLVDTNLQVIRRLCASLGIAARCKFILLKKVSDLDELDEYDGMMAFGTQHHMPHEYIEKQWKVMLPHLKVGGLWYQLAYPIQSWNWATKTDFHNYGQRTDGEATPWAEWYEPGKLQEMFDRAKVKMEIDWCGRVTDHSFVWFGARRVA